MIEIYDKFFQRAKESAAHSKFCEKVFGLDLSQDGFSDLPQLDFMIKKLNISRDDRCLDVGCGNGKIADYVSGKTGARVDGLDSSQHAVRFASLLAERNKNLRFFRLDVNDLSLVENGYTVIYLIDSIYFSNDYEKTINALWNALEPGGRIAFFYSEFVFEKEARTRKIPESETKIARIFRERKWEYTAADFTKEHFELMKRKHVYSNELKNEFLAEGNEWLFKKLSEESVPPGMGLGEFEKFTNRYLYVIRKRRNENEIRIQDTII